MQVFDIGSGKGYFASELSLKHKVPVIGFDSNDTNTHGASKRDKRLAKKWVGLERKTRNKQVRRDHLTSVAIYVNRHVTYSLKSLD